MTLQSLFDRSPVLPVDAAISLARYLHTARQTQLQAVGTEQAGDVTRAALLHIRVLQLTCKTLPSHPDYALSENTSVLRELRAVANVSFRDIERLAARLKNSARPGRALARPGRRGLVLSNSLIELFQRMSTNAAAVGDTMLGLLAKRTNVSSPTDLDEVTSLVIPSQTHGQIWSFVRYDQDVAHLLEIKNLSLVGLISVLPRARRATLPLQAAIPLAAIQTHYSNAVAITIAPRDQYTRLTIETLSDNAVSYVTNVDSETPDDTIPEGFEGEGTPVVVPARHVERRDGTPTFKLYDLRPLAITRDSPLQNTKDEK